MQQRCHTGSHRAESTPRTDGMKMIQQHTPAATFLSESPPRPMVTAMPLSHTDQEGSNQPRTPRLDFDGQCDQRCSETHESCELLSCNHQITHHLSLCGETQGDMGCSLRDIELFEPWGRRNAAAAVGLAGRCGFVPGALTAPTVVLCSLLRAAAHRLRCAVDSVLLDTCCVQPASRWASLRAKARGRGRARARGKDRTPSASALVSSPNLHGPVVLALALVLVLALAVAMPL